TLDGRGGNNRLDLSNFTTGLTFNVTGADAGNVAGVTTFTSIQNLTGGSGNNTFVFSDGASVGGSIDGGPGTNTLDYSAYTSNVIVNLAMSAATGVGGTIANIENVLGGNGGAAGTYNILVGNGGNVLTGGNGRRNLLIAGAAPSVLLGGNDEDIL